MNVIPEIEEVAGGKTKCRCVPKCDKFYKINGFDIYCKGILESLAMNIIGVVKGVEVPAVHDSRFGWTTKLEKFIINYVNTNGVQNGTYSKIAAIIGKKPHQVKNKVYQLEKQGRLEFERVASRKKASDASRVKNNEVQNV